MRGAGPSGQPESGTLVETSPGGGLRSYPEGPRKLRDGWRWHSKGCRSAAARGRTAGARFVRAKAEAGGGEAQMNHNLAR